ncbi:MAG: C25 family cysteine peptidase [Bacteroidales bacterium]|jgi:hypothetical protein|nr:C25 family cysteine peptidase [Bacteroidales bacterium]
MKKFLFYFLALILNVSFCLNINAQELSYSDLKSGNGISINMTMKSYDIVTLNHKGEEMHQISVSGIVIPNDEGMPNIPRLSRLIAIPQGATASFNIKNIETETINNLNIAPALRLQSENEEPEFNYTKNKDIYDNNAFYPVSPVEISERTSLRGVDAIVLGITPFQYNPVTKELIAIKKIDIEIIYEGGNHHYGNDKYRSRWFDPILKNALFNYDVLPDIDYNKVMVNESKDNVGCEYLIVIPNNDIWLPYAEQLKDFRTKQGILTKIMRLDEMEVTTPAQMKTFFHNAYNTWDIPPVAVLLMADHKTDMTQGIPGETISHPLGSCITDNQYADVNGDLLPEMVFARMTAETEQHLQTMVSKTLEYEYTNPCMDEAYYNKPITALGWQTERWFQICSEVVGGYLRQNGKDPVRINEIYDGIPGNVWSTAQNTNTVVNYFGQNGLGYLPASPTDLGNWSGGTAADVISAINNGAFMLQHRDHGYEPGWGEPNFTTSHAPQINNQGKLTYIFTINCLTGKFNHTSPCFIEVYHRLATGNQNRGAVGLLGPTETSYSFVNDVYIWGVYDLFDPDFMPTFGPYAENSGNWLPAFGNVAGKYFLYQSSWPYNTNNKNITYQMFTAHGDAFLRLFTEVPREIEISHLNEVMMGTPLFVTCEEGALVALTVGDEIISVFEGTGSEQEIQLPIYDPQTEITVVATKQNRLRYVNTVLIIPATGPYIISNGWNIYDENNNGKLDYAETADIGFTVKNIGADATNELTVELIINDDFVTIEKSVADFGTVQVNEEKTIDNAFSINIANNIPDNYVFDVRFTMTNNSNSWSVQTTFTAYAPVIQLFDYDVVGDIIPGATVTITPIFINEGGSGVFNPKVNIIINSDIATLNTGNPISFNNFDSGETSSGSFNMTVNNNANYGEYIPITVNLAADNEISKVAEIETLLDACNISINSFPWLEDFETTTSIPECWTQEFDDNNYDWYTYNGGITHKPYSAHSGSINMILAGYGLTKLISPSINVPSNYIATLSFWHAQTAKNEDQDILRVYYKTSKAGEWILLQEFTESISDWTKVTIELPDTKYTSNYYFAFEGEAKGAYGVVIDDVGITLELNPCMDVIDFNADYQENTVNLTWTLPQPSSDLLGYDVYFNNNLLERSISSEYEHTNIPYLNTLNYCVVSVFNECTGDPVCLQVITCPTPSDLSVDYIDNNIILEWSGAIDTKYFNIYKNDVLIAAEVTETSYSYYDVEIGEHTFKITAVYENCDESEGAEEKYNIAGINNIENNLMVYPNPATNYINIEGKDIAYVTLFNSIGQIINKAIVNGDFIYLDINNYNSGIYFLKVNFLDNTSNNIKIIINNN